MTRKKSQFAAEIDRLKTLTVEAASYLAGVHGSTLRSAAHQIQPDADGKYSARDVVDWVVSRGFRIDLSDDDRETLLRAVEAITEPRTEYAASFAVSTLRQLRGAHGRGFDHVFVDEVITQLAVAAAEEEAGHAEQTNKRSGRQLLASQAETIAAATNDHAMAMRGVRHVCRDCGKVRHGAKWIDADDNLPDEFTVSHTCPACDPELARREQDHRQAARDAA